MPTFCANHHQQQALALLLGPFGHHLLRLNCALTPASLLKDPPCHGPCRCRRKEENMLKKSIGFNWGPCAVSTSYWTGVRLRDLLLHVGARGPAAGGNFVCFRGPKGELPKGDDGSYGTSLTWVKAMDPASDVIIAYKQVGS
jgi:DMSO/TMAO reductase YedYZ molybdopterin-dependent catalytic subunit